MSEYGDFCREQRQWKQSLRMHWHECPNCAVRFGTGTSVAPGTKCRNCDWVAPGERGDDVRKVREWAREERAEASRLAAEKAAKKSAKEAQFEFECPYCERRFFNPAARGQHVNRLHQAEHAEKAVKLGKRKSFKSDAAE